jgi:superfamily II DNA or RNA helicase
MSSLSIQIWPSGHLALDGDPPVDAPIDGAAFDRISSAFSNGTGPGLLHLGATEVNTALPPALAHFRTLAQSFVATVLQHEDPSSAIDKSHPLLPTDVCAKFLLGLPPVRGAEYVNAEIVAHWWSELRSTARELGTAIGDYLHRANPIWNAVGRVHFHLAENRRDPERPFAFLATYATGVSEDARVKHAPLGQAWQQYAGSRDRTALLSLLAPVDRAAQSLDWVQKMVTSGSIRHPLSWTPGEALNFLRDEAVLEQAGLVVRMPDLWKGRPARVVAQIAIGSKQASGLGVAALLDFNVEVTLDGEALTEQEIRSLLSGTDGLAFLRGRWVQIDRDALSATLARWSEVERAHADGIPFLQALRLVAGADGDAVDKAYHDADSVTRIIPGPWLAQTLEQLRSPEGIATANPEKLLRAVLRPYQRDGIRWLWWLRTLGLGGCLADDMGLGKTLQVIGLVALSRRDTKSRALSPCLVVAPASLLGNWRNELSQFAPALKVLTAHSSEMTAAELKNLDANSLSAFDVVLTSYASLQRIEVLQQHDWDTVIADEAQAIKNPATRQARVMRSLSASCRLALTGTPVENRISDLWSIFAFSNPGLLGSPKAFGTFIKRIESNKDGAGYAPLRALVGPFILRRTKTQKHVIADLPDKTEVKTYCALTRKQGALYQQAVEAMSNDLKASDGIARKGIVLSYLTRFKQICNHPAHWLQQGDWDVADSGKLRRLIELADEIAARQEKVLVFTQFQEAVGPISNRLANVFGRPGLVISGKTPVGRRQELVEAFKAEGGPPFFVLSLRAGGTGLNLTAANHVIHFDRWWNPAVENQATDRAFRIGQKRNVLVHKLICRGTLEEKIDGMIDGKRELANQVVNADAGASLTELSDRELLKMVSLDPQRALEESP